ncbi:MAG: rhomboid family intramembrane serine protease [Chitinispirillales bacterium]|jgi:membrane associated rhomboid family serine protease|nr:rhomboid family intramembrane serine protease [Chitinispirillales bacterium]
MMYLHTPRLSPCVKWLIGANVVVFILQMMPSVGDALTGLCALRPYEGFSRFQLWRLATYMFLHAPNELFHILFNMLTLWWFGAELEEIWGRRKFLAFYFVCGVGAGLFSLLYFFVNPYVIIIGASGAVLGLLTAYAVYYPHRQVMLFGIFPMRMRTLVIGYAVISVLFSIRGGGNVAHLTHLGGIAVAWVYLKAGPAARVGFNKWMFRMKRRG